MLSPTVVVSFPLLLLVLSPLLAYLHHPHAPAGCLPPVSVHLIVDIVGEFLI